MLEGNAVRSVQRALDILEVLADSQAGMTRTTLSGQLGLPRSADCRQPIQLISQEGEHDDRRTG